MLKLPEIRTQNHSQTPTLTGVTTRYEKPSRDTKIRTLRYGFNNEIFNEFTRNIKNIYATLN